MLGADKLEVDGVYQRPDLPGTLAGRQQVVLDLVTDNVEGVAVDQTQIGEKDAHKDGAPEQLVNGNLEGHMLGLGTGNLVVEPVVKVVSGRSVVNETKDGKSYKASHIKGTASNENLNLKIKKEIRKR